jgi:FkbM family methyltransferase
MLNIREELELIYKNRLELPYPYVKREDLVRDGMVVFGAGQYGSGLVAVLLANGVRPDWIIDKNPELTGHNVGGIPIHPLSSFSKIKNQFIVLGSSYILNMIEDCKKYNQKRWILPGALTDIFNSNCQFGKDLSLNNYIDKIEYAYSILADQRSREIFIEVIKYWLTFQLDLLKYYDPAMYFAKDLAERIDYGHFIDAGAFTGDTLVSWIKFFQPQNRISPYSYTAFEPSTANFEELNDYVKTLPEAVQKNIFLEKCALGEKDEKLLLVSAGGGSNFRHTNAYSSSGENVPVKRLDDMPAARTASIIKADVEGFEIPLLEGARGTIEQNRPSLLISAYHNFEDVWEIPNWVHILGLNYQVYLRHHQPTFGDTVCYAIPK